MGDITYPRVDGEAVVPGAFLLGGDLYLPRKGAGVILVFRGWTFRSIQFTKADRAVAARARRQFNRTVRKAYLRYLVESHAARLRQAGISEAELALMTEKGRVPMGFEVHHLIPLDDGGDNSFANLMLIRAQDEHSALSAYQTRFTRRLAPGDTIRVDYPVPGPGLDTVVFPERRDTPPMEIPLWK